MIESVWWVDGVCGEVGGLAVVGLWFAVSGFVG